MSPGKIYTAQFSPAITGGMSGLTNTWPDGHLLSSLLFTSISHGCFPLFLMFLVTIFLNQEWVGTKYLTRQILLYVLITSFTAQLFFLYRSDWTWTTCWPIAVFNVNSPAPWNTPHAHTDFLARCFTTLLISTEYCHYFAFLCCCCFVSLPTWIMTTLKKSNEFRSVMSHMDTYWMCI